MIQCRSEILVNDLVYGTVCQCSTRDLITLERCIGKEAAQLLCGEGVELDLCLHMIQS